MQVLSLPPAVLYTGRETIPFVFPEYQQKLGVWYQSFMMTAAAIFCCWHHTHMHRHPAIREGYFQETRISWKFLRQYHQAQDPGACSYCGHWNGCLGQEKQDKKSDNAEGCGAQKRSTWWDKLEAQKQLGQCQVTTETLEENVLRRHVQNTTVIKGAPLAQCNPKGSNFLGSKGFL